MFYYYNTLILMINKLINKQNYKCDLKILKTIYLNKLLNEINNLFFIYIIIASFMLVSSLNFALLMFRYIIKNV